ncbi:carbohydrate kinase [Rhodobacteraceae bacterium 2CG4]|uniref:Carbohydrate kinase n=1 Tax=Halovulum marinum TaxID=2662447 RepID=A0A6L5Z1Z0_9RHOB|nr:carbohydrate kinase [Halovulum marinum]MSU90586.1 carbohydrate kinase [Halovulum marinum]
MILVGGENLIDFIQDPPDGGHPAYRAVPGGAPFNVAKATALQEVPVGYLTPFSSDPLGRQLLADLVKVPNMTALHPGSPRPTSLAVVSLTDGQARYQFYREGTAERDVTHEGLAALVPDAAEAFFIGSLAITDGPDARAWTALYDDLAGRGIFTALDPNIRAAFIHDRDRYLERLDHLLAGADLVKLSDEDIAWLAPGEDPRAAARRIAARSSAGLVVLTLGAQGAFAITADGEVTVPVHPVRELKDTVGAGDTFMGTLMAETRRRGKLSRGGLTGLSAAEAAEFLKVAARAAAINCERSGCNPPTLAQLQAG